MQSWSASSIGHISQQLLIARFDQAQDLPHKLKGAYLGLASLERSLARERARFACFKDGDAGPHFFRIHAAHRRQKNRMNATETS